MSSHSGGMSASSKTNNCHFFWTILPLLLRLFFLLRRSKRTEATEFMRLNPGEAVKYDEYWAEASGGEEYVSGKDARAVLCRASKVSKTQLRLIWEIADHRQEGSLGRSQFLIALRLIALAQRGAEISVKGLRNFVGIQLIPAISPPPPPPPPSAAEVPSPESGGLHPQAGVQQPQNGFVWTVGNDVFAKYDNFFHNLDANGTGFVDGAAGVSFFGKSGLPRPVLKKIWQLADVTRDGKLSRDEFRAAMHMVSTLRTGRAGVADLPQTLDPQGPFWLRSEEEAAMFRQTQQRELAAQQSNFAPPQQAPTQPSTQPSTQPGSPSTGGSARAEGAAHQRSASHDFISTAVRPTPPPAANGDLLGGAVPLQSLNSSPRAAPMAPRADYHDEEEDAIALRQKLRMEQQEASRAQRELELMKAEMEQLRLEKAKSISSSREQELRDQNAEVERMRIAYQDVLEAKARAEEEASRARLEASRLKQESMRAPFAHASPTASPRKQLKNEESIWSESSTRPAKHSGVPVPDTGECSTAATKLSQEPMRTPVVQGSPAPSPRKQSKKAESIWSESSPRSSKQSGVPTPDVGESLATGVKLPPAPAFQAAQNTQGALGGGGAAASADDFFGGKAPVVIAPSTSPQKPGGVPGTQNKRSGAGPARPARLISDDSVSESDDDDFWGSSGAGAKPKLGKSSTQPKGAADADSKPTGGGFGNDLDEWAF